MTGWFSVVASTGLLNHTYHNIFQSNLLDTYTRNHSVDTRLDSCCYSDKVLINMDSVREHLTFCYTFMSIRINTRI